MSGENVRLILGGPNKLQMRVIAITLTLLTVILAIVRFFQDGHLSIVVTIQLASAVVFLLSTFLFQTKFKKIASHVMICGGFLGIFAMALFSGEIKSEAMFWVPFVPLLAAFLTSYRSVVSYTFLALVALAIMYSTHADSSAIHYISLATAVGFSSALGVFLERSRIKYEERLAEMATSHPLTGLPSRSVFEILLSRRVGLLSRQSIPYVLVFIDVDRLKPVNDSFGHTAGDALLREVGRRLDEKILRTENLFHISGDEFIIISDDTPSLESLKARVKGISGEFVYMDFRIPLSVSVGATRGTIDSEASLSAADSDMYLDKTSRSL